MTAETSTMASLIPSRARSRSAAMLAAARSGGNLVPPMVAASRAEATLGEICGALRQEWGSYAEPAAF